jgi:putative transposase
MVLYRRNRVPGGTFFFTLTLANRRSTLLTTHIDLLRESWRAVRHRWLFETVAMVVLPERLHAVWRLPAGDDDFPGRGRAIKAQFTPRLGRRGVAMPLRQNGAYRLWQPRYWERTLRDDVDLQRHVDYIHYNPVKHALAGRVADWPYSSFHRYARLGRLSADWGGKPVDDGSGGEYGE